MNTHELCRHTKREGLLPTRVLEIKMGKDGTHDIDLVESSGTLRGEYACLSYCWGEESKGSTTKKDIANPTFQKERKKKIYLKEIPETVTDAITLCGKLGFQYLWVDRLCIIQDDESDWSREASKMSQVYSNSALTITTPICGTASESFESNRRLGSPCSWNQVTRFSLPSGNRGQRSLIAIGEKMARQQGPCFLEESWYMFSGDTSPASDIWITRAWTFQEWLLSPRVLHIHEWSLWDCFEGYANEVYRRSLVPSIIRRHPSYDSDRDFCWERIVGEYSKRQLSNAKDTLPALAGLAARHAEKTKHTYLAGLWLEEMPNSLLWRLNPVRIDRNEPKSELSEYGKRSVPSWSWASSSKPIWCSYLSDGEVSEASIVSHSRGSSDPLSFVNFEGGWLDVEGPMCPTSGILLGKKQRMSESLEEPARLIPSEAYEALTHTLTDNGRGGEEWRVYMDDLELFLMAGQRRGDLVRRKCQLWLLRLVFHPPKDDDVQEYESYQCLLLGGVPSIGPGLRFQRLGLASIRYSRSEMRLSGDWQRTRVRLV